MATIMLGQSTETLIASTDDVQNRSNLTLLVSHKHAFTGTVPRGTAEVTVVVLNKIL